ncbi:MAG TPA: response regulator [Candidatus Moranbacteria bacterium]|nr:response regulator [Candidatus Moranbacteria bacterium]HAT74931.1 response regulator [Candidatus Moranbacteria bacterium]
MAKDKQKIMIVEDDFFMMDIYNMKLEQEGFEVIGAKDGVEALKKLKEENITPDLILLDILMPFVDGLEVLKELKKDERLKKIPVVLLSNLSQKADVETGMKLGAKGYIIKSHFTPSEVLEKIKSFL